MYSLIRRLSEFVRYRTRAKNRKTFGASQWGGRTLHYESLETRRVLAVFMVTNTGDGIVTGPGDQPGTLRQAIFDADNVAGDDKIEFAPGLDGAIIALTQGELSISEGVAIDASLLPDGITIVGVDPDRNDPTPSIGNGSRIFNITDPTGGVTPPAVTIKNLTLTGGRDNGTYYLKIK